LTPGFIFHILLSGMNRNLKILNVFSRKALFIAFILLIGFSFSAVGAPAKGCPGGFGCLNCEAAAHPHMPGMDAEMVNHGCQSAEQNRSCGFEAGSRSDQFDKMATVAQSGTHPYPGIFSAATDEFDQAHLLKGFVAQFQYPDRGQLTPIYLLTLSLLC